MTRRRWRGSIVLHSPDHKAMVAFFMDVLGFRLSDWLGDFMAFLRCNEWHHRLAVAPGPPCLNHVAFDMLTVDDMMRGIGRLKRAGTDLRWATGATPPATTPSATSRGRRASRSNTRRSWWRSMTRPMSPSSTKRRTMSSTSGASRKEGRTPCPSRSPTAACSSHRRSDQGIASAPEDWHKRVMLGQV